MTAAKLINRIPLTEREAGGLEKRAMYSNRRGGDIFEHLLVPRIMLMSMRNKRPRLGYMCCLQKFKL